MYNIVLKSISDTDFYYYAYPYFDFADTIFYIIAFFVFIKMWRNNFKKVDLLYKHSYIVLFLLLTLKISYSQFNIPYEIYTLFFWTIVTIPFLLKIERNINR